MLPHKTHRGENALHKLKAYEGIPPLLSKRRRLVVPSAMTVLCLRPGRKYCHLGRLSHEVGWKYKDVIRTLEVKRKVKAFIHVKKMQRKQVKCSQNMKIEDVAS